MGSADVGSADVLIAIMWRSTLLIKLTCDVSPSFVMLPTVTLILPNGREAVFRAGTSKSIYDIASYAGVHLPASCKQGQCSACCCRILVSINSAGSGTAGVVIMLQHWQ